MQAGKWQVVAQPGPFSNLDPVSKFKEDIFNKEDIFKKGKNVSQPKETGLNLQDQKKRTPETTKKNSLDPTPNKEQVKRVAMAPSSGIRPARRPWLDPAVLQA